MFETEFHDDVCVIKMTHGKVNSLDLEFCNGLNAELETHRNDQSRALVLTGTGGAFSAGVDLLRLMREDVSYTREFLQALSRVFGTAFSFPKPLVAAINGHAIAGGCILACTADVRLMAEGSARIGIPELRVGVPFPAMALEIMRFATAPQHFQTIALGGATYKPDAALPLGLIDGVVDGEELAIRAMERAQDLADLNPDAFRLSKQQIRYSSLQQIEILSREFEASVDQVWCSDRTRGHIQRFVEKTFGGKKG